MNVLPSRGAGFIGSPTVRFLAQSDNQPITYDHHSTGHASAVRQGPLVVDDLADGDLLRATMREHRIDAVMHFAASAYVGESITDPCGYFRNNVVNSLNLLDAMIDVGVEHIVISSSCATYGIPDEVQITERTPQHPINPYGESKLFIELALRWYGEAYGFRWVVLRYFNAAGADPDGEISEDHDSETHLIQLVIQTAQGTRPHVDVFGTDYPTPDGTAVRDYVHVTDLADAHLRALHHLRRGGASMALNLSTGQGYPIQQVIDTVERLTGMPVPRRVQPRRLGDPAMPVGSAPLEVLGWRPEHSDLDTIVRTAWGWHS